MAGNQDRPERANPPFRNSVEELHEFLQTEIANPVGLMNPTPRSVPDRRQNRSRRVPRRAQNQPNRSLLSGTSTTLPNLSARSNLEETGLQSQSEVSRSTRSSTDPNAAAPSYLFRPLPPWSNLFGTWPPSSDRSLNMQSSETNQTSTQLPSPVASSAVNASYHSTNAAVQTSRQEQLPTQEQAHPETSIEHGTDRMQGHNASAAVPHRSIGDGRLESRDSTSIMRVTTETSTQADLAEYTSGYRSGYRSGYESGFADGQESIRNLQIPSNQEAAAPSSGRPINHRSVSPTTSTTPQNPDRSNDQSADSKDHEGAESHASK